MHKRSYLLFLGEGEQVSPVEAVEGRIGAESRHDPGIDGWNNRIVLPGEYQGRLMYPMQPINAGPAQARQHLPVVSQTIWRPDHLCISTRQVGILLETPAIDNRRNGRHIRRLKVPARTKQFGEDIEPARHRDSAGRS